ncbi:MAG: hypothetical protein P1U56_11585 [Saprospiraceae bacterium]|nr:hypothetical protein [Saprospiraceae bacterium]
MKNSILVFVFTICLGAGINAQVFGVKTSIGVSLAQNETTFAGEAFDYINHEIRYQGTNIVKSIGVFGQEKFGYLYGRAELSYTNFKQEYRVRSFVQFGQGPRTVFEEFQFIDFQLMAGLTHNNFRFGVGPVAHILVGNETGLDFISGYNENHRSLTYGLTTAVGLDAGRFFLDVRYENNFRTLGEHINYGTRNSGFDNKPHIVNLTLGISI